MRKIKRRKEPIDLLLLREINHLHEVRDEESLQREHRWKVNLFRNPVRLDDRIKSLLAIFAVELNPPGISLRKAIQLVRPEAPWCG
jgi:hypothetical protein